MALPTIATRVPPTTYEYWKYYGPGRYYEPRYDYGRRPRWRRHWPYSPFGLSPYQQWWELSATDDVSSLKRERWYWLLGGIAAGFAAGGLLYSKM